MRKAVRKPVDHEIHILDEKESRALKITHRKVYVKAAIAGVLGVVLLYIPHHYMPWLFPSRSFWIPVYNDYLDIEIEYLVYGWILVFIEIWYLTYLNIHAVNDISVICGYPYPNDPRFDDNVNQLVRVGLEKKHKRLTELGIDPYDGLSKWGVFLFQILLRMKAMLSNLVWKFLVARLLGRYAFRLLVNLFSAPLYAAWNVYGARKVMTEARVQIIAPPLIDRFAQIMYDQHRDNVLFRNNIYEALQAISVSKRSFHHNHFVLANTFLNKFNIPVQDEPEFRPHYLKSLKEYDDETRKAIIKLFIFGILIDGRLSAVEGRSIARLYFDKTLPYSLEEIQGWSKDFYEGRGLEDFFNH